MKPKTFVLTVFLTLSIILTGCNSSETSGDEKDETKEQLNVYTTIFPIKFFTERIGGEHVEVKNLMPPGADAHTFDPTAKTMIKVAENDALIYNGANMEGYMIAIKESLKNEEVRFFEASEGIELVPFQEHSGDHEDSHEEEGHNDEHGDENAHNKDEDEHDHAAVDEHVWLDPIRAIAMAENIQNALIELKPKAKKDFQANFETLKKDLQNLNEAFQTMVENTPKDTFLVSHAAYGYWENRYNLHQLSISGLSPTDEPSQMQLEEIVEEAKEHNIQYVLFEQNISPKVAKVIQQEIGAQPLTLHNLSTLTEKNIEDDEDYFSIMQANIETLKQALK
jgi:zinc transport system substrate-binding protein